jgi:hypothetical protein
MKTERQTTSHLLMVRPASFGFNAETATSNAFQSMDTSMSLDEIRQKAIEEFDTFVNLLRGKFLHVHVLEDSADPMKPDAIFPNNWISFHEAGFVITYPMEARVRRLERNDAFIYQLANTFVLNTRHYLEFHEMENKFLEGTGSMVLDRVNKIAYACLSSRTHPDVLAHFCQLTGYTALSFTSHDQRNKPVYHTNVMMAMGDRYCVISLDSISDQQERTAVIRQLQQNGKEIIDLTLAQMDAFAGNMLQVSNDERKSFLVMSEQAYNSLRADQVDAIRNYSEIIAAPLYTIEKYGGGSARCMIAEIFLPKR